MGISDTGRDDHETIGIPKFKEIIEDFEGFEGFQSIGHIKNIEGLAYSRAIGEDFGFKILDRLLIDIILAHTITKYILILREFLHEDPTLKFLFKYKRSAMIAVLVDRHGALGIGKADLPIRVLLPMPGGLHYKFYKFDHVLQIALTLSRIYAQLPSEIVSAAPRPALNCACAPTSARRPDDALEWVMESEKWPHAEFGKPYKCDPDFVSASHIKSQLENAFHMGAEIPNSLFLLLDKIIKEDGLL